MEITVAAEVGEIMEAIAAVVEATAETTTVAERATSSDDDLMT